MKLNDIKPKAKSLECFEIKEKEYKDYFINSSGNAVKNEMLYKRNCPVCAKDCSEIIFNKFSLNYVQCSCGMVYITPYISFEHRQKWYVDSKAYGWFWQEIVLKTREKRIENIWKPRLVKLKEENCSLDSILDIGCGSGEFVELMQNEDVKHIVGIELNSIAVEIARKYTGDSIIQDALQNVNFSAESFSLITLWEVFHHFDEPKEIMQKIFSLLKPGGKLVMQSPNFSGFDYNVLQQYHHDVTFEIPNYFSTTSMFNLLKLCGFLEKDIYITTPGCLDLDYVLWGIERYGYEIVQDSFVKAMVAKILKGSSELKNDLQRLLIEHNMSGSMLVVAQKSSS